MSTAANAAANGSKAPSRAAARARRTVTAGEVVRAASSKPPVDPSSVALDLDALEREGSVAPLDALIGGRVYVFSDPQSVDWQDLITAFGNPVTFFRLVLAKEDHAEFFGTPLPVWKMNKLMDTYMEHYGLPSLPNAIGLLR